jgi:hypothetical protein
MFSFLPRRDAKGPAELRPVSMVPCRTPGSLWFIGGDMLAKHFGQCSILGNAVCHRFRKQSSHPGFVGSEFSW